MKNTIYSILLILSISTIISCGGSSDGQNSLAADTTMFDTTNSFAMSDSALAAEDSLASATIDSIGGVADTNGVGM